MLQVLPAMHCGQEFGNGLISSHAYSSGFYRGMPRNGSPPWRPDDKDGHYVFAIGEALTPRCKYKNRNLLLLLANLEILSEACVKCATSII